MSSRKPVPTARPPHVLVDGVRRLLGHVDREPVLLGIPDGLVARPGVVPHGGDDLEVGRECGDADLEAHLVVALAGATVAHRGRTMVARGLDQVLGNQRPGQRGDERVSVHVERVCLQRRQAVVVGKLVPGIDDDRVDGAAAECALADGLQVLAALADVDGDGDHVRTGLLAQPADGHGGVEPSRVCEYDAFAHGGSSDVSGPVGDPVAVAARSSSHTRSAFCTCRRFSAWSQTTLCGPSMTSGLISMPR